MQNQANVLLLKLSCAKILTAAFLEGNKKESGSIFCYFFSIINIITIFLSKLSVELRMKNKKNLPRKSSEHSMQFVIANHTWTGLYFLNAFGVAHACNTNEQLLAERIDCHQSFSHSGK